MLMVGDRLELRGGEKRERGVSAAAVVEDLDVLEDFRAQFGFRWPAAAVDEFLLEGCETPRAPELPAKRPLTPAACRLSGAGGAPSAAAGAGRSDVADGDHGGVAAGFVGRAGEVAQWGVGKVVDVDVKRGDVAWFESLDQGLGGQSTAAGGARLDAGGFVDLVAEGRDFGATAGEDLAYVDAGAPVQPEAQDDVFGAQPAPHGDVVRGGAQRARGGDAGSRGCRLRAGGLGEEVRHDAVADVAADDAAGVDDDLVGCCDESAPNGEVVGCRQSP